MLSRRPPASSTRPNMGATGSRGPPAATETSGRCRTGPNPIPSHREPARRRPARRRPARRPRRPRTARLDFRVTRKRRLWDRPGGCSLSVWDTGPSGSAMPTDREPCPRPRVQWRGPLPSTLSSVRTTIRSSRTGRDRRGTPEMPRIASAVRGGENGAERECRTPRSTSAGTVISPAPDSGSKTRRRASFAGSRGGACSRR